MLSKTLVPALVLAAIAAAPCNAQTAMGENHDLQFVVIDATSGQPGSVERLQIDYLATRPNTVVDVRPDGSEFTLDDVPVKDIGSYLVTAWSGGVPYWWQIRGNKLIEGPTTLHVFQVTDDLDGVAVEGLNLVVRRQDTLLAIEAMLVVRNDAAPQVTVMSRPATLELMLPAGAADIAAEYQRGPEPTPIEHRLAGAGRLSLAVPLTPGSNRVRVTAQVPWRDGLELPVSVNVPVEDWSLLAAPEWLGVEAFELESAEGSLPGYARYEGPALESGRQFVVRLAAGAGPAEAATDAFGGEAPAPADTPGEGAAAEDEGGGMLVPLVFAGVLIIIVAAAVLRRRGG